MLTITKLVKDAECSFCLKPKEGAVVQFTDEAGGESVLCWPCVKKMAQRKMRLAESGKAAPVVPLAQVVKPAGNSMLASAK